MFKNNVRITVLSQKINLIRLYYSKAHHSKGVDLQFWGNFYYLHLTSIFILWNSFIYHNPQIWTNMIHFLNSWKNMFHFFSLCLFPVFFSPFLLSTQNWCVYKINWKLMAVEIPESLGADRLIFSAQGYVSYRNQSFVLQCKSNDWFLYVMQHWIEMG